jgi:methionyl-tRNA formyltransferase
MKIQILVDNINSWIIPYAKKLEENLNRIGHTVNLFHLAEEIVEGDILCLLSCEKKIKQLNLNKYNLIVHESNLPSGKGWSPLTWQVLEGENKIPVTLIEATDSFDSGEIYLQKHLVLEGHELVDELRELQGTATIDIILEFITNIKTIQSVKQIGEETFYPRRNHSNSELDIHKTISEQFNLLRVVDNDRYPAFFIKDGIKYKILISKFVE